GRTLMCTLSLHDALPILELFAEGYGDEMRYDPDRVGITWAQFTHMYMNFYVFQYATGISGAHALAKRIQEGEEGAVEAYINFLRSEEHTSELQSRENIVC